ncbi:hypothetical protein [Methylopila turkensis]|uniref:Uncharacterized protein n=1 Tax=Methylopila turkensis TaxID=1437816 RepID=A0A9W6JRV1_9HYPH|nr:hypothetical protein [Methylopila turkensis]GLK81456.1 hypothetical protein GCM10008174_31970 [Methylopila turkensis]
MTEETPPGRRPAPPASAETIAEARRLFETTELKQVEICKRVGLAPPSLSRMIRREGWMRPHALARRRETVRGVRAKVDEALERVEPWLAGGGAELAEAERAAKTLASLVRTLRELARYDAEQATRDGGAADDDAPADLDALRDELARRLARLRAEAD